VEKEGGMPWEIQEEAFRAYCASMSDAELLSTAKNKNSSIPIAQMLMAEVNFAPNQVDQDAKRPQ
jgi:hypothetical protein